ncbi:hypothetical protein CUTER_01385 [Corynebacterium uterequi]|uniref:Uncharacterized protein n=1 Tax=Corynebacterium uterequi TaxID=1072256 RepID=A0A0G3HGP1_9CORY|nr:hypothetical protein CUTER_01385 [Corynebacterium uterequi]
MFRGRWSLARPQVTTQRASTGHGCSSAFPTELTSQHRLSSLTPTTIDDSGVRVHRKTSAWESRPPRKLPPLTLRGAGVSTSEPADHHQPAASISTSFTATRPCATPIPWQTEQNHCRRGHQSRPLRRGSRITASIQGDKGNATGFRTVGAGHLTQTAPHKVPTSRPLRAVSRHFSLGGAGLMTRDLRPTRARPSPPSSRQPGRIPRTVTVQIIRVAYQPWQCQGFFKIHPI